LQTKSPLRLSDLCHMRHVRQRRTRLLRKLLKFLHGRKKEAGFPAPLEMTNKVYFVFFLVPVLTAHQRRSLHAALSSRPASAAQVPLTAPLHANLR
jgi:hypothetical protein